MQSRNRRGEEKDEEKRAEVGGRLWMLSYPPILIPWFVIVQLRICTCTIPVALHRGTPRRTIPRFYSLSYALEESVTSRIQIWFAICGEICPRYWTFSYEQWENDHFYRREGKKCGWKKDEGGRAFGSVLLDPHLLSLPGTFKSKDKILDRPDLSMPLCERNLDDFSEDFILICSLWIVEKVKSNRHRLEAGIRAIFAGGIDFFRLKSEKFPIFRLFSARNRHLRENLMQNNHKK